MEAPRNPIGKCIHDCVQNGQLQFSEGQRTDLTIDILRRRFLENIEDEETAQFDPLLNNVALIESLSLIYAENADEPALGIAMYQSLVGKSALATYKLALKYYRGKGVEKDAGKAAIYCEQVTEMGDFCIGKKGLEQPYSLLAHMYYNGNGVEQDYVKAKMYYQKAVDCGDESRVKAIKMMDDMIKKERQENPILSFIDVCVSAGQLHFSEGQREDLTVEILKKRFIENIEDEETRLFDHLLNNIALMQCLSRIYAEREYGARYGVHDPELGIAMYHYLVGKSAEATNNLALKYLNGEHVEKDAEKAIELLKQAAAMDDIGTGKRGYALAYLNLGCEYHNGKNVVTDYEKAEEYFKKGADLEHEKCLRYLASLYASGKVGELNRYKGFEIYQKAHNEGEGWGTIGIATCYQEGFGVEQNQEKTFEIYQKAHDEGNWWATLEMAECYEKGIGVKQNEETVFEIFRDTIEKNPDKAEAFEQLARCYKEGIGVKQDTEKAKELEEQANQLKVRNVGCYVS